MEPKIKDTTPFICPAGIVKKSESSVKDCLKNYPTDDAIEMVLHEAGLKRVDPEYKRQKMLNTRHRGIFDETRKVLSPPIETRYQTLLRDLKETVFDSYWNKDLGKSYDVAGRLPGHIHAETTTFGQITPREPIKDIINPPKTMSEILSDEAQYHEMYKKSHSDYYPGEQISHNYDVPTFKPDQPFGKPRNYNPKVSQVTCLIKDINSEPITRTNFVQADFIARTRFQVGKSLAPNNNISCLPPKHRFGEKTKAALHGVGELMKPDEEVSLKKKDFFVSFKYLYQLRQYIKRNKIDLKELIDICLEQDKEKCGCINLNSLKNIFFENGINFNVTLILNFVKILGFYKNNLVKYEDFINLFDVNKPLPELPTRFDNINYDHYYVTSYQSAQSDFLKIDNSKKIAAGTPSIRTDIKYPSSGLNMSKSDTIHLGQETNVECLINPSIYSNYGLTHYDFWEPRAPEYLKRLFEGIGFGFPNDTFSQLWEEGVKIDKTGFVCIDTFKNLLYRAAPLKMKTQPPITCDF